MNIKKIIKFIYKNYKKIRTEKKIKKIYNIKKNAKIKVFIIDYDGVLASQNKKIKDKRIDKWMNKNIKEQKKNRIFILSNLQKSSKKKYIEKKYKNVIFLKTKRKKPFSDGIYDVFIMTNISPSKIKIIDDRIFTGIISAVNAKTKYIIIKKTLYKYKKKIYKRNNYHNNKIHRKYNY